MSINEYEWTQADRTPELDSLGEDYYGLVEEIKWLNHKILNHENRLKFYRAKKAEYEAELKKIEERAKEVAYEYHK